MSPRICLASSTLDMLQAGGHMWVYLNWGLGLQALGCRIFWLETVHPESRGDKPAARVAALKERLRPFGLDGAVAVWPPQTGAVLEDPLQEALSADLLVDIGRKAPPELVRRFRRSALVDIDPGLTQIWATNAGGELPAYDAYFTIGETVGAANGLIPDCGVRWHHVPPPIHLPEWPVSAAPAAAPWTTVSSWWGWYDVIDGEIFLNDKRSAFLDVLDLPSRVPCRLELALALWKKHRHPDVALLEEHGWTVRHAFEVAGDPAAYRDYIVGSRGEFSCAKPSCARLANAWISDRTLCYLATGRPAVVQHTGESQLLPQAAGLLRFTDAAGAARTLGQAEDDYDRHCRSARALVEEHFDATVVLPRFLDRALP